MIDRLTEKWVAYTCSEKGEAATDKEDVRFLLNALADELEQEGSSRYPYVGFKLEAWMEAAIWTRSERKDNDK